MVERADAYRPPPFRPQEDAPPLPPAAARVRIEPVPQPKEEEPPIFRSGTTLGPSYGKWVKAKLAETPRPYSAIPEDKVTCEARVRTEVRPGCKGVVDGVIDETVGKSKTLGNVTKSVISDPVTGACSVTIETTTCASASDLPEEPEPFARNNPSNARQLGEALQRDEPGATIVAEPPPIPRPRTMLDDRGQPVGSVLLTPRGPNESALPGARDRSSAARDAVRVPPRPAPTTPTPAPSAQPAKCEEDRLSRPSTGAPSAPSSASSPAPAPMSTQWTDPSAAYLSGGRPR
jgi:hypothetical protein